MRNQRTDILDWPYQEGLRLDEAQHPLTLLAAFTRLIPALSGGALWAPRLLVNLPAMATAGIVLFEALRQRRAAVAKSERVR